MGDAFCECREVLQLGGWCEVGRRGQEVISAMNSELCVEFKDYEGGSARYRRECDRFFEVAARQWHARLAAVASGEGDRGVSGPVAPMSPNWASRKARRF